MKRISFFLIVAVAFASCKNKIDHEAIVTQISQQYDFEFGQGKWGADIHPSEQSPLLYEALWDDGIIDLFSIDTKHSKVVDRIHIPELCIFGDGISVSNSAWIHFEARGTYSATTDSTFRVVYDSVYSLVNELKDDTTVLFHLQRTKLFSLRNLHFEKAFEAEEILKDFDLIGGIPLYSLYINSCNEYNEKLLSTYQSILKGDSLSREMLMQIIPQNEEQFRIYFDDLTAGRMEVLHKVDSTVCYAASRNYDVLDKYLNCLQYSDGWVTEWMLGNFYRIDSVNPLLFRQAACYIFDNTPDEFISNAIREYPNEWYDKIFE